MRRLTVWIVLGGVAAGVAHGSGIPDHLRAVSDALPAREVQILLDVGRSYGLCPEGLKLLLTIRKIENGRPGVEMGVASNFPRHPARQYAHDPVRSLRIQARWAAGTIRKRYTGDLEAFAKRYCPPRWQHWTRMARFWMNKTSCAEGIADARMSVLWRQPEPRLSRVGLEGREGGERPG